MPGAAFNVTVSLDMTRLEALMPRTRPVASELIRKHAYEFEAVAKAEAPVDTGALRNSIRIKEISEMTATITDGVEYGVYQEFGVNHPYLIGKTVYIRGVGFRYIGMHPGFEPQPFFTPAAESVSRHYFVEYFPNWLAV